jgi:hypothetical protein
MKDFILGLALALAATFLIYTANAAVQIQELQYRSTHWEKRYEAEVSLTSALRADVTNALSDLKSERALVALCEQELAKGALPQVRQCSNVLDPIAGPGTIVSTRVRAAWARIKKVPEAPMQGAWELVVAGSRIYLDGRLMPSLQFAVDSAKPRRWLFVVNKADADVGLSRDLVQALDKARAPESRESGVIHITEDGEEIPRRTK